MVITVTWIGSPSFTSQPRIEGWPLRATRAQWSTAVSSRPGRVSPVTHAPSSATTVTQTATSTTASGRTAAGNSGRGVRRRAVPCLHDVPRTWS